MPDYLTRMRLKELNIIPGAIVSGELQLLSNTHKPHIEDASYQNLRFDRVCSGNEFREILKQSLSENIEAGFGVTLDHHQKHISPSYYPSKSLITISVNPKSVTVFQDNGFGKERIKIHFMDKNAKQYRFMPVNDLGYWLYAKRHFGFDEINSIIHAQKELFLRVGLGRFYKNPHDNREGYWIQINGIYSFPSHFRNARIYE
jgi:hypothetical protein